MIGDRSHRSPITDHFSLPLHPGTHLAKSWNENLPMTQTPTPSAEEREQIMQTIEMFGVIVQSSPNDSQSLEILKDAFVRIGQQSDAIDAARKLAELFTQPKMRTAKAKRDDSSFGTKQISKLLWPANSASRPGWCLISSLG